MSELTVGEARPDYQTVDEKAAQIQNAQSRSGERLPNMYVQDSALQEKPQKPSLGWRVAKATGFASLLAYLGLAGSAAVTGNSPVEIGQAITESVGSAAQHVGGEIAEIPGRQQAEVNYIQGTPEPQKAAVPTPQNPVK